MAEFMARREVNPLLCQLCTGDPDRRILPSNSIARQVFLSKDGARLLQALIKASKPRVAAVLAWLEVAAKHLSTEEAIEFALAAADVTLLHEVLIAIDGPDVILQPALRRTLNTGRLRQAVGISVVNRLLHLGVSTEIVNLVLHRREPQAVRTNLAFAETYALTDLAKSAAHLCDSTLEVVALDHLARDIMAKAPNLLPDRGRVLQMKSRSQLVRALRHRLLRHREPVVVPPIDHERLTFIGSVSALRAAGGDNANFGFENCLRNAPAAALNLVTGEATYAIYESASSLGGRMIMRITLKDHGSLALIEEIKARGNEDVDGQALAEMLRDLNANTPITWKLGLTCTQNELGFAGYLWD